MRNHLTDAQNTLASVRTDLTSTRDALGKQSLASLITALSASDKYVHEVWLILPLKGPPPTDKNLKSLVLQGMNQTSWSWSDSSCATGDGPLSLDGSVSFGFVRYSLVFGAQPSPQNSNLSFSAKLFPVDGYNWIQETTRQISWNHFILFIRLRISGINDEPAGSFVSELLSDHSVSFVLRSKCVQRPLNCPPYSTRRS